MWFYTWSLEMLYLKMSVTIFIFDKFLILQMCSFTIFYTSISRFIIYLSCYNYIFLKLFSYSVSVLPFSLFVYICLSVIYLQVVMIISFFILIL